MGFQLSLESWTPDRRRRNVVIVPVSGVHRAVVQAIDYAKALSDDVRAVFVNLSPTVTASIAQQWETWGHGVPLVILSLRSGR